MLVRLDLLLVLMEVRVFLVMMIVLYQKKYLLVRLLYSVHLEYMSVLSNMVVVLWCLGDSKGFLRFVVMLGLNLSSVRVYLRCYVVKEVWEFLLVYCLKVLR